MAWGLRIANATGSVVVSNTTRVGRIIGSVSTNSANGSVTVPDLSLGTPYFLQCPFGTRSSASAYTGQPVVKITGNTVTWTYTSGGTALINTVVYYGIY